MYESFDYYFITDLLPNFLSKNFENRSAFRKVMVKEVDCLMHHVHWSTVQLKEELCRDPTWILAGRSCCNSITLRH